MTEDGSADKLSRRIKLITADLKRYAEKRIELMVINVGEQYARWIAESIQRIGGLILLFGALVFVLVAIALYLGALLNSPSLGFVIVSLPLFAAGFMLFNLKPQSISERLRSEFEEELVGIFKPDTEERSDKQRQKMQDQTVLESNQLEQKNEHNVRREERNTAREEESIGSRTRKPSGRIG